MLFVSLICFGVTEKYTKRVLGIKGVGMKHYLRVDGPVFYEKSEYDKAQSVIERFIRKEGYGFGLRVLRRLEIARCKLEQETQRIRIIKDYRKLSQEKIIRMTRKLFARFDDYSTSLFTPLFFGGIMEADLKEILARKIADSKLREEAFRVLTTPEKEAENDKEIVSILRIASLIKKRGWQDMFGVQPLIHSSIRAHLRNFNWLGINRMMSALWEKKDIMERLKMLIAKEPEKKLIYLQKYGQRVARQSQVIVKQYSLDKDLIKATKASVFYRNYRMMVFSKCAGRLFDFWQELARRLGLTYFDLTQLTSAEIVQSLKNKRFLPKDIEARKENSVVLLANNRIRVFTGKKREEFKKNNFAIEDFKIPTLKIIKGNIGNTGKARGVVKIVIAPSDMKKVNPGDILVSPMTIPEFVPAMEKAAAFITDEGGILCHAAIISREMRKPCIIGTKMATKILRDGDLVEVDADQGVVKILARKKFVKRLS